VCYGASAFRSTGDKMSVSVYLEVEIEMIPCLDERASKREKNESISYRLDAEPSFIGD
jgi:hypothetical protein